MTYELVHSTRHTVTPGRFHKCGATVDPDGVNFALYSQNATEVFLLLFDGAQSDPSDIIQVTHKTRNIWHCHVQGIKPGQRYGYKVRGEYDPAQGKRFNEHKLLLDPYAKAIDGKVVNKDNLLLAYDPLSATGDLSFDRRDSTYCMPKAIVVNDAFDWKDDAPPAIPFEKLLIYEVHVKGFTAHPSSGIPDRGTYLGFIGKIPYLKSLGINAVELLPVHEFYVDDFLLKRELTNYWGYNTIGFFAPEQTYGTRRSPGCQVDEFKTMVRELHRAGMEVLLDVVYNHTGEGNELGPTISFRGIDNTTYYALAGTTREPYRYYINPTGCGNAVNSNNQHVIRFVMDSLRYWVEVMHVDGFRFDLASVLGREGGHFQRYASFFDTVSQDPVLQGVKLIAEPWDLSTYQVGNFPIDWSEWNGKFRDTLRKFIKGDDGQLRELGYRLTGSADLYCDDGRSAYNSINFITCHDGFTLHDLVSYNHKHNEANKENNNDGTNDNNSWNCCVEGETNDPAIIHLRKQMMKNHACALLFSNGTPMLLGGDEFMRTQHGNNNAYCQDNEISWFDWHLVEKNGDMVNFFRKAIAFTKHYPILQKRRFFLGKDTDGNAIADLTWFGAGGQGTEPDWCNPGAKTLCLQLDGCECEGGKDYRLFIIYNADWNSHTIWLPGCISHQRWRRAVDTSLPAGVDFLSASQEELLQPPDRYIANARSTVVLVSR